MKPPESNVGVRIHINGPSTTLQGILALGNQVYNGMHDATWGSATDGTQIVHVPLTDFDRTTLPAYANVEELWMVLAPLTGDN